MPKVLSAKPLLMMRMYARLQSSPEKTETMFTTNM